MKKRTVYESREQFERLHPYVSVETPHYNGKKAAPAQIVGNYTSKKVAENNNQGGEIMTRKQAVKFIERWNREFEQGNFDLF